MESPVSRDSPKSTGSGLQQFHKTPTQGFFKRPQPTNKSNPNHNQNILDGNTFHLKHQITPIKRRTRILPSIQTTTAEKRHVVIREEVHEPSFKKAKNPLNHFLRSSVAHNRNTALNSTTAKEAKAKEDRSKDKEKHLH